MHLVNGKPRRPFSRAAFRFFHENAGGIVGQQAITAYHLARAESAAAYHELRLTWENDADPDLGDHGHWCDIAGDHGHEVLSCFVQRVGERDTLASLGGIIDPDNSYCRVVEAELAFEALSKLYGDSWA